MPILEILQGQLVFKEGDSSDYAYFLQHGAIELTRRTAQGESTLGNIGPGGVFGESGLFDGKPRSSSARATQNSVVQAIDKHELDRLLLQCPEPLLSLVKSLFERMRSAQKPAQKELAPIAVPCDFETITIAPGEGALAEAFAPVTLTLRQLPYIIGGFSPQEEGHIVRESGLLSIPCEGPPLVISKRHLVLEIQEDAIFAVDRGSRFGTYVNGKGIGRGRGIYKAPLYKGEFSVQFATLSSPYKITLTCA